MSPSEIHIQVLDLAAQLLLDGLHDIITVVAFAEDLLSRTFKKIQYPHDSPPFLYRNRNFLISWLD
jgi:hypothetical protein